MLLRHLCRRWLEVVSLVGPTCVGELRLGLLPMPRKLEYEFGTYSGKNALTN